MSVREPSGFSEEDALESHEQKCETEKYNQNAHRAAHTEELLCSVKTHTIVKVYRVKRQQAKSVESDGLDIIRYPADRFS